MIVMSLKVDNFYGLNNFKMNMSYPRKIINSKVKNEHLKGHSNFRYKKLNIIMGANASGKTTLGKMMMTIFNYIENGKANRFMNLITDTSKDAKFEIEFVTFSGDYMYNLFFLIPAYSKANDLESRFVSKVRRIDILKNDSYETCSRRLQEKGINLELKDVESLGWFFTYPLDSMSDNEKKIDLRLSDSEVFTIVFKNLLMTLDGALLDIVPLKELEGAYLIKSKYREIILQDGKILNEDMLSSGTKAGINIAEFLTRVILAENGFYYCDEKFSYIHSDLEKEILSIIIDRLGENEQVFFTSHNLELTRMPLPKHSFNFIRKRISDEDIHTDFICVGDILKKNTDSVKYAVDNDLFGVGPSLEHLNDLEDQVDIILARRG